MEIHVTRGDLVESVHQVALCAVGRSGNVILAMGDVDAPIYLRSAAKPFIAAAVIAAGARERFELQPQEIAVMAASHTARDFHLEAVHAILRKIGMGESALQCGELGVRDNCSGKHAGILALCAILGADPATYLQASNPAQQRILGFCARLSGRRMEDLRLAVDGCGIPVYATPLRDAARAFMRFATLEQIDRADAAALRAVRDAMLAFPQYVAGPGEFDTRLMQAGAGEVAAKGGAEGVHACAFIRAGVGLVTKVADGAARGRAPAVLAAIRRLALLNEISLTELADLARLIVYNRAGRPVGEVRPS